MAGEEAAIADENAECHAARWRLTSGLRGRTSRRAFRSGLTAGVGFEFVETHELIGNRVFCESV
jgi:hypothetical protein